MSPLRGPSRQPVLVARRRRIARWLWYRRGWTQERIGRLLRRDHSTVSNLINKEGWST